MQGMENLDQFSLALAQWETFPIRLDPRPLILTGDTFELEGFKTGAAKLAFMEQNLVSDVLLPDGLLARLGTPAPRSSAPALRITAADPVRWSFSSDRGKVSLAAWDLTVTDALGPIHILDPTISTWWPPGIAFSPTYAKPSQISADGMTLTYVFDGPAVEYYRVVSAHAVETATAVVIDVHTELLPSAPPVIPAYAQTREVNVSLRSPLAGRVLIHPARHPLPVLRRRAQH